MVQGQVLCHLRGLLKRDAPLNLLHFDQAGLLPFHLYSGLQSFVFQVQAATLLDNLHRIEDLTLVCFLEYFELVTKVGDQAGSVFLAIQLETVVFIIRRLLILLVLRLHTE